MYDTVYNGGDVTDVLITASFDTEVRKCNELLPHVSYM